jgi:hypothetical protein
LTSKDIIGFFEKIKAFLVWFTQTVTVAAPLSVSVLAAVVIS